MTEKSELKNLREKAGLSFNECLSEGGFPHSTWYSWEALPDKQYHREPWKIAFVWLNLRIENERLKTENERLRLENECLKSGRVFKKWGDKS